MHVMTASEAAQLIRSGDTVGICGVLSLTVPETVLRAIGQRFQAEGSPRDLTIVSPSRPGWDATQPSGIEHFGYPGMTRRLITSAFNNKLSPRIVTLSQRGEIATYSLPMGTLFRWLREVAAGSPGLLTEVGIGTYLDPGIHADTDARVNLLSAPLDLVSRIEIDGRPCLLYRSLPINVAVIRGTVADTQGNISLTGEPVNAGVRHLAMAAHNSGGIVIAQVKHITQSGTLNPRLVEVPGIWVDVIVVDSTSPQSCLPYEPAFVGETRSPILPVSPLPLDERKVILRRATQELRQNDVLNLGYGIPNELAGLAQEEGFADQVTFTIEHGAIGGLPGPEVIFGAHYNPEAIIDQSDMFSFYEGGGLDATLLGFAEVDATGSVNNGRFNNNLRGPGGMINILHRTRTILFCGTLTAGGLHIGIHNDPEICVEILHEGRFAKFVEKIQEIDFSGPEAVRKGQRVLFITERAVFRLTELGLCLDEVAPGISVESDIRPVVKFDFSVNPHLRHMDASLFQKHKRMIRLPSNELKQLRMRERNGGTRE